MATDVGRAEVGHGHLRRVFDILFSFEALFGFYLYSNNIKYMLASVAPWVRVYDETLLGFLASLAVGVFLIYRNGIYLPGFRTFVAGMVFFAWVFASYMWTPSDFLAQRELTMLVGGIWSLAAAALIIASSRERVVRFLVVTALVGFVTSVYGWYFQLTRGSIFYGDVWRSEGFAAIYQQWGQMAAMGGLASLAIAAFSRTFSPTQWIFTGLALANFSLVLIAGSRLSLVAVLVGTVVAAFLLPVHVGRGTLRLSGAHLAMLFALVCGVLVTAAMVYAGVDLRTLARFSYAIAQIEQPEIKYVFQRPYYFEQALRMWFESPLVGQGIMSMSQYITSMEISGAHPHNIVAEILAETGLIGMASFMFFVYMTYRNASLERLRNDHVMAAVLITSMLPWVNAMLSMTIGYYWNLYAVMGLMSLPPPSRPVEDGDRAEVPIAAPAVRRVPH